MKRRNQELNSGFELICAVMRMLRRRIICALGAAGYLACGYDTRVG